jgi:hypothetical protein
MLILNHTHQPWHHTLRLHRKGREGQNPARVGPHATSVALHTTPGSEGP